MSCSATTRYRLGSSGLVHAPGIVAWAINGYAFKKDRKHLLTVITNTWKIPEEAAHALLNKTVPYEVDGEVVVFEA